MPSPACETHTTSVEGTGLKLVQFDDTEQLRSRHPAWALLKADNASLVLTFLDRVFVKDNRANVPASPADR